MADFDKISINGTYYNVKDTAARQQITEETRAREAADTALGQKIAQETSAREEADSHLAELIEQASAKAPVSAWIYPNNPPASSGLTPAKGDHVTDDFEALQAIVNYAAKNHMGVMLDRVYKISQTLNLPTATTIVGIGASNADYDVNAPGNMDVIPCGILYTGNSYGVVSDGTRGLHLSSFSIIGTTKDGNATGTPVPTCIMQLNRVRSSRFDNLTLAFGQNGLFVTAYNPTNANDNSAWNLFTSLQVTRAYDAIFLNGDESGDTASNACHNTFIGLNVDYFKRGIILGYSDNNAFYDVYCFGRGSSASYGVEIRAGSRSNYFYHLQGRVVQSNATGKNWVFGYDTENGQQAPYFTGSSANARLFYITSAGVFGINDINGNKIYTDQRAYAGIGNFLAGVGPATGSIVVQEPNPGSPWAYMYFNNNRYSLGNMASSTS